MITNLAFLVLISSGSVFGAACFQRKYEELLPVTTIGITLLLFLLGVFGKLQYGVYIILILATAIYFISAVTVIRKRNYLQFFKDLVTPAAVIFTVMFCLLSLWNAGRQAMHWDEFSHWVDIVKVMVTIDDFGTNPAAQSVFGTYPPIMALFQYLLQKVYMLLQPGAVFSEWRVYLAYQVFLFSVMMPLFKGMTFKKPLSLLCMMLVVFASPLVFYEDLYSSVYIDAFLGILSGTGLTLVFFSKKMPWCIFLYIAALVLAKDAGLFFAVMLAGAVCVSPAFSDEMPRIKKAVLMAVAGLSVLIPKLLWMLEIQPIKSQMPEKSGITAGMVMQLFCGKDPTYRNAVMDQFRNALYEETVVLGNTGIALNYVAVVLTELAAMYFLYWLFVKQSPKLRKQKAAAVTVMMLQPIVYTAGLCVIYAFDFSEYEAVRLASMHRYISIAFLSGWIVILYGLLVSAWKQFGENKLACAAILYCLLMIIPTKPLFELMYGDYIEQSAAMRKPYGTLTAKILEQTQEGAKVYLISQENTGLDYWVMRFSIRPNSMNENYSWSIGEPFFDGDIWTRNMTAQQWQELLLKDYDYVALYRVNDYFVENFQEVFANPKEIEENSVFWVNKETGLLELCQ